MAIGGFICCSMMSSGDGIGRSGGLADGARSLFKQCAREEEVEENGDAYWMGRQLWVFHVGD